MRMYAFLLNHMQEHKHCECRSRELHTTFWIAWELGLRSAPPSSRHPQEGGLDVVDCPVSRRGLLRCPWGLFPGPGHTFLLTSSSNHGCCAGLSSLLWGWRVADDDLERAPRHDMAHGLGALLSFRKPFDDRLYGITKVDGGSDRCVQQHLAVCVLR